MTILPPPPRLSNSAAPPLTPNARRVAEAHRHHHDAQVGLSCGEANSLAADEAADAYRDAVADAVAANVAKVQELVATLRLLAEDETGLRELARPHVAAVLGVVPAGTLTVLADVVLSERDTRREVNALAIDLLEAVNGVAAVKAELSAVVKALRSTGIAVRP